MNILFLTKSKQYTNKLLDDLVSVGDEVTVICKDYSSFRDSEMEKYCLLNNVSFYDNGDLYKLLTLGELPHYDFAISNTYGKLIKKDLIEYLNGNIINLHGAILPDYKGAFAYNWALYNLESVYGVTAHFVNEKFDEGDIIEVSRFPINPEEITVSELELKCQETAYELTKRILEKVRKHELVSSQPQDTKGHYYSRQDFENLKKIERDDADDVVERKYHACWCPPYDGTYIEVNGDKYFLVKNGDWKKLTDRSVLGKSRVGG